MPVKNRQDKGILYENFITSEITKKGLDVKYWRTKSKAEVDFIVEKEGRVLPVEVKSGLKKPKLTKSFHSFIEKYKPKEGLILSETLHKEKNNIRFRPIFSLSKEIL